MKWFNDTRRAISEFISPKSTLPSKLHDHNSISLNNLKTYMSRPISEIAPGLSQPVWGPEISTVGAYSREGYTSRTFDAPAIDFRSQAIALQQDEDVQISINSLASKITGGHHYISTENEEFTKYFERFTDGIEFDRFDTIFIKELLWYGNSVWKPRMGIRNVRSFNDLMHIPISSFVRVWWDRQRQPYKYEFRGAEYQGYHNPGEIIHFNWNPIDASVFGTGFGVTSVSSRIFEMVVSGDKTKEVTLPSMLDRKYAIQFIMQMASQRYVTRNVYSAPGATEDERNSLQSLVENLQIGEDLVSGTDLKVEELGTNTRAFNPEEFMETVQSPIMKAMNDFQTKQGSKSSPTYANAETAQEEKESNLAAFIINAKTQLKHKLFHAWYDGNPIFDPNYLDGIIPVDWYDIAFDLNFGQVEKKDIPIEQQIKLIELFLAIPGPKNPKTVLKLFEQAGMVINEDDFEGIEMDYDDPNGEQALAKVNAETLQLPPYSDIGGGEIPQFNNQVAGDPPMDNPIYDSMAIYPREVPSNFHQSNQSQDWKIGRNYE